MLEAIVPSLGSSGTAESSSPASQNLDPRLQGSLQESVHAALTHYPFPDLLCSQVKRDASIAMLEGTMVASPAAIPAHHCVPGMSCVPHRDS